MPVVVGPLAEGDHRFEVHAVDGVGHATVGAFAWTVDTTPPQLQVSGLPPARTAQVAWQIDLACDEACSFTCNDAPCTSPWVLSGLHEGGHEIRIEARDAAGNAASLLHPFEVDRTGPAVTFTQSPADPSNTRTAIFDFDCGEAGCTYECFEGGIPAACTPPVVVKGSEGTNAFAVAAIDSVGNRGVAAMHSWRVDVTPPTVLVHDAPPAHTSTQRQSVAFSCNEPPCSFTCTLDGGTAVACTTPHEMGPLAEGEHLLHIHATDEAGNRGPAGTVSWTVDRTAPTVAIVDGPSSPAEATDATFTFGCSESSCTFSCALDDGAWAPCASPATFTNLSRSSHTLQVRAADAAGNVSAPATFAWSIERRFSQISSTTNGGCAVTTGGELYCWGSNGNGRIGDAGATTRPAPVAVAGGVTTWAQVSTTWYHTCAVRTDGSLWCWGLNALGRTGLGTTAGLHLSPMRVGVDADWTKVTSSSSHSCALKTDGTLWCWGTASLVGTGATATVTTPDRVGTRSDWSVVDAGDSHSCGIAGGELHCWGGNSSGQLGVGTTASAPTPVRVGTDADWTAVRVEGSTTCARRSNGGLYCWGANTSGQLGDGTLVSRNTPPALPTATNVTAFDVAHQHVCLISAGELYCHGDDDSRKLGLPVPGQQTTPTKVGTEADWAALALGRSHTCALRRDGTLACFGSNGFSQLGVGIAGDAVVPQPVTLPTQAARISSGGGHVAVVGADGSLYTWGGNDDGELGRGDLLYRQVPARVGTTAGWTYAGAGQNATCAIRGGSLYCWGQNYYGTLGIGNTTSTSAPTRVGNAADWTVVEVGYAHACGIRGGALHCWGRSDEGQVGHGSTWGSYETTPVQIGTETNWVRVALGGYHSCAIKSDGTLWCWGRNEKGQLGDGTLTQRRAPVRVGTESDWVEVVAGFAFTCGRRAGGTLHCWGDNAEGQCGALPGYVGGFYWFNSPRTLPGNYVELTADNSYACGVQTNGAFYCWGSNMSGVHGNGNREGINYTPTRVGTRSDWALPAAGESHNCANLGGVTHCWGSNVRGQHGAGTAWSADPLEVIVH